MKKMLFVYNPKAGKAKIRGKLADILDSTVARYPHAIYVSRAVFARDDISLVVHIYLTLQHIRIRDFAYGNEQSAHV